MWVHTCVSHCSLLSLSECIERALAEIWSEGTSSLVTLPPPQAGSWEIQPVTVAIPHSLNFYYHSVIHLMLSLSICLYIYICMDVCVSKYVCMCIYIYVCVYVYVCMYVCICIFSTLWVWTSLGPGRLQHILPSLSFHIEFIPPGSVRCLISGQFLMVG